MTRHPYYGPATFASLIDPQNFFLFITWCFLIALLRALAPPPRRHLSGQALRSPLNGGLKVALAPVSVLPRLTPPFFFDPWFPPMGHRHQPFSLQPPRSLPSSSFPTPFSFPQRCLESSTRQRSPFFSEHNHLSGLSRPYIIGPPSPRLCTYFRCVKGTGFLSHRVPGDLRVTFFRYSIFLLRFWPV